MTRCLTTREVAHRLGVSERTVERAQASALRKLREAFSAPSDPAAPVELSIVELAYLLGPGAREAYCRLLMSCKPGELPDSDPPPGL
jgi:hypothetical protein